MDHYIPAYTCTGLGFTTFEDAIPTSEDGAAAVVAERLAQHGTDIIALTVYLLEADTGSFRDVSEDVLALVRETAFKQEMQAILEHPLIHPRDFCFACWQADGQCWGCRADAAHGWAAE